MIKMFVATTIVMALVCVVLLAVFAAPWWLTLLLASLLVLALNRLLHPNKPLEEEGE